MNTQILRVRIRTEDKGDVEWTAKTDDLTFGNALFAISQVLPNVSVTAFEYEDEDGDRITVRTDEELQTMLKNFMYNLDGLPELPPLVIFPRVGKTPQDRNIHGLKIQTKRANPRQGPVHQPAQPKPVPVQPNPVHPDGSRRSSGHIEDILHYGNIKDGDLHYQEVLGNGNGGSVFRSTHVPSNKTMAVKVIELDITKDVQKQIISELQVLDQCQSDNIITFYGAFFEENRISICMEFMDGGSLDRLGVIPEPVLGQMSVSILRGLLYLWSKKIMHRDVKPSNILVNTSGQVKLCDFGVSKELVNSITKTYVGTNAYMAPERIEGKEYSLQSDVWSLGVTLFELATGKYPYNKALLSRESSPKACMVFLNSIVNEHPPTLSAEFFPLDLISFVAGCMRQAPKDRLRPIDMENHNFILRHKDNKMVDVAAWVRQRLMEVHRSSRTL